MNRRINYHDHVCAIDVSVAFMTGMQKGCDSVGPSVSLSRTDFNGKSVRSTFKLPPYSEVGLKTLRITKFIGTTIDNTYGTNGTLAVLPEAAHTLNYTLAEEGLQSPIRFKFGSGRQ
ncbi:MAG: hypothetical protein IPI60_18020 [Saprospiraceae bacterium]|nr:hypothetical protein [Saprospiraceae bacterium]